MINRDFLKLIGYRVSEQVGTAGHVVLIHGQFVDAVPSEDEAWVRAYQHYTNAKPSSNWLERFTPEQQKFISDARYRAETTDEKHRSIIDELIGKMAILLDQSYKPPKREIVAE